MKEIKKYKLSTLQSGLSNFNDHMLVNHHTEFVKYSHVEQLQARIKELESEISKLGATCEEYSWKINKLEHVNYINEIKAQGIEEAIIYSQLELLKPKYGAYHWKLLCKQYIEQLRTKHD